MRMHIVKAVRIEFTDNHTGEEHVIVGMGDFVPEYYHSTVTAVTVHYIECPVVDGVVIVPDHLFEYDHDREWFAPARDFVQ